MDFNDSTMYTLIIADDLQDDLDDFVYYLLIEKMSIQAANALLDDYVQTVEALKSVAGSLRILDDPKYAEMGYRKIRFRNHNYYLIYTVEERTVTVLRMFHDLQDMDGALK